MRPGVEVTKSYGEVKHYNYKLWIVRYMNMKRRYLYLKQLFEGAGDGGNGGAGGDGGTGGAGGTGAGDNGGTGDDGKGGEGGNKGGTDDKKYTDADIDRIINKKFAEWQKKQDKAVKEAEKLANMNAQEKAEHERDEWEKKYNTLLAENNKATLTAQATRQLADDGITGLSDTIISALVTDEADTTKENIKSFSKAFKAAVQSAVKEANKKPSPKTGGAGGTLTKADIMKVEDINERQRLIRENYELFRK